MVISLTNIVTKQFAVKNYFAGRHKKTLDKPLHRYYLTNMLDLRKLGQLVALERNRKGWSQRELRDRLEGHGFTCTPGYIGGVEKGSLSPSREFAVAAEKALELKRGYLLMYLVANHVEKFCDDLDISLQDYMNMIGLGIKSIISPFVGAQEADPAERPAHPSQPRPTLVTKKVSRRRSIMVTQPVFKYA